MGGEMDKAYEISNLLHEISEREEIINNYNIWGSIDRNSAIEKILSLRSTDKDVAIVTVGRLVANSIPFSAAPDQAIVAELKMQVDILKAKLLKEPMQGNNQS